MPAEQIDQITRPQDRIIAALDMDTWAEAYTFLGNVRGLIGYAKVNSLADRKGIDHAVEQIANYGLNTFVDYKPHDVEDTMRRRAREIALGGASMITIHTSMKTASMKQAVQGVNEAMATGELQKRPMLIGVTVLTDLGDNRNAETCHNIYGDKRARIVLKFARKAAEAELDAIVSSPLEAEMLKNTASTRHLKVITPAIRPEWAKLPDEQVTATTPTMAIRAGADYLVVGRPLTNPYKYGLFSRDAAEAIVQEITEA